MTQTDFGEQSPVGQRHLVAPRLSRHRRTSRCRVRSSGQVVATLHEGRLPKRDDRRCSYALASLVCDGHVISLVERNRLGLDAFTDALQEVVSKGRLVRSRRLHSPRDRKAGARADSGVSLYP